MAQIKLRRIAVESMDDELRINMYSLFEKYYLNTDFDRFCAHLKEKDHVLTIWTKSGSKRELVGFSTVVRRTCRFPEPHVYLFSGDTVIDRAFWASKYLQKAFFWYILETKLMALNKPVYWFLICKGHKTYLMMRKNFSHSFPNRKETIPNQLKVIMDQYYGDKYKSLYCRTTNLIRFQESSETTRREYFDITTDIPKDPDGAFFLSANPDFSKGVELACIAEIRCTEFFNHLNKYFFRGILSRLAKPLSKGLKKPESQTIEARECNAYKTHIPKTP